MIFVRFKPAFLAGKSFQFSLDILRARAIALHAGRRKKTSRAL